MKMNPRLFDVPLQHHRGMWKWERIERKLNLNTSLRQSQSERYEVEELISFMLSLCLAGRLRHVSKLEVTEFIFSPMPIFGESSRFMRIISPLDRVSNRCKKQKLSILCSLDPAVEGRSHCVPLMISLGRTNSKPDLPQCQHCLSDSVIQRYVKRSGTQWFFDFSQCLNRYPRRALTEKLPRRACLLSHFMVFVLLHQPLAIPYRSRDADWFLVYNILIPLSINLIEAFTGDLPKALTLSNNATKDHSLLEVRFKPGEPTSNFAVHSILVIILRARPSVGNAGQLMISHSIEHPE